jgi:hypothetical protein
MKKTVIATAVALTLGMSAAVDAGTAGLTGKWRGTYEFIMTSPLGGPVGGAPAGQKWVWDFDAGTIRLDNAVTFYASVWTAHDVTFTDNGGGAYGTSAAAANMWFDWSVNTNLPVSSEWDVAATGNSFGDTAVASVNYVTILASSLAFPGFHPAFIGGMTKVPLPAAVWLMGSGLIGLVGVARRRRS